MTMALPSSTLAFAFGKFERSSKTIWTSCPPNFKPVKISLYASKSKLRLFEEEYLDLTAKYLISACELLGEYPFSRLDLVIMPRCFGCMGLERYLFLF